MTDTTPRLALPELVAAQAQKHVTVNEALVKLDCLTDLYLISMSLGTPPDDPSDGDAYVVASEGSGDWTNYDGKIAYCIDGAWRFYTPCKGLRAYNAADSVFYLYTGTAWVNWSTTLSLAGSVLASGNLLVGDASGAAAAVAMSGDATLDDTGALTLAASGAAAGTYTSVTVDKKGRVTAGTSPTALQLTSLGIGKAASYPLDVSGSAAVSGFLYVNGGAVPSTGTGSATNAGVWLPGYGHIGGSGTSTYEYTDFACNIFYNPSGPYYTTADGTRSGWRISLNANTHADNCIFYRIAAGATSLTTLLTLSSAGHILPGTDGTQNLGSASLRYGTVYASTGTINTSDETLKTNWTDFTDAHKAAATRIKAEIGLFQFVAAVTEKGADGARLHTGVPAQGVWKIMIEEGLETAPAEGEAPNIRHAFLCYDAWEAEDAVTDENGCVIREARAAGEIYGVRPDELALFLIACL